ncbi:MAG: hypothetical protein RL557_739 [archaeon]
MIIGETLMAEILQFKVYRAEADYDGASLHIKLFYSKTPGYTDQRLGANPEWGVRVLEDLLNEGHAVLANEKNPVKPPSAGSLVVLNDNTLVCHRRDKGAPVHSLYFSTSSGFPRNKPALFTREGLTGTGLQETAEELLLITKDREPRLIVTPGLKNYTLASAQKLGLDMRSYEVTEFVDEGTDTLDVFYEDGTKLFSVKTYLDMMFDMDTSLNILQIRRLNISSDEVVPVDIEGFFKNDKYIHFNRESFLLHPREITNLCFAEPLQNPRVSQSKLDGKFPQVYSEVPQEFLGPGGTPVTHPYLFAPDNLLTVGLDALRIPGYTKKKLRTELWKEQTILSDPHRSESALIPSQYRK